MTIINNYSRISPFYITHRYLPIVKSEKHFKGHFRLSLCRTKIGFSENTDFTWKYFK